MNGLQSRFVNGDARESFRAQSVVWNELSCSVNYEMPAIYLHLQQTVICCVLPAGAVYVWLFYRYICLFHHRL
jgi:hypothetical protein